MAVGPVTLNGVIPRTQDMTTIKQQEDHKPVLDQHNIQTTMKTQGERQLKQVNHKDDANEHKKKYDAKEKGSNAYHGQQQKKKRKQEENPGEKTQYRQYAGGFDMKI